VPNEVQDDRGIQSRHTEKFGGQRQAERNTKRRRRILRSREEEFSEFKERRALS
jgi:hypothetical protein